MSRTARSLNAPHDPDAVQRLPVVGGPLDGKTRKAEGLRFSRKDWTGEYRRTTSCWQWTPPPGKDNPVTDIVSRMGLVSHPTPAVMADNAEAVAKRVRRDGTQTIRRAAVLAARGLRAATGGIGSSDPTTPTERAAGLAGDGNDTDPPINLTPADRDLIDIDAELARLHRKWWALGTQLEALYDRIQSHASDDDPIPAGTGLCACGCNHFCDPRKDQEDRLKSRLAPACYRRWLRWRATYPGVTWSDFIDACHKERGETRARPVAGPRTPDEDVA